jgi:hypothetical protein
MAYRPRCCQPTRQSTSSSRDEVRGTSAILGKLGHEDCEFYVRSGRRRHPTAVTHQRLLLFGLELGAQVCAFSLPAEQAEELGGLGAALLDVRDPSGYT